MKITPLEIAVTEFQIILTLILVAGGSFAAWLYRHERWFRNIVFPVIQALTGRSPRGNTVDRTDGGHFQETENRLQRIEEDIESIRGNVQEVGRRQDRHNQRTEAYLRRVIAEVEGVDLRDIDEPLFRGNVDEDPVGDGGQEDAWNGDEADGEGDEDRDDDLLDE
jgi:hypothetical protein